jgi:hypothetical protein
MHVAKINPYKDHVPRMVSVRGSCKAARQSGATSVPLPRERSPLRRFPAWTGARRPQGNAARTLPFEMELSRGAPLIAARMRARTAFGGKISRKT